MSEELTATPPPAHRQERKVVSALFADIVGSTRLGERLDPDEYRLIITEAVAVMVQEVERLGGHVKDLAGDGLLAFFGAPVSHEDDAERAVRAGLAIADELRAYGDDVARGWGIEGFAARVGIATGSVALGPVGAGQRVEYSAYGDTVNVASRLQSRAADGTVIVDEQTHRAVAPLFEWGNTLQLEVKGKDEPLPAYEAKRVAGSAAKPRGIEGAQAPLVGREAELSAAEGLVTRTLAGVGGVLLVTGEAGIGKSRVLAELRERFLAADSAGAPPLWLEGRCVSYGDSLPYWPFRELLRAWLGAGVADPELRVRVALRHNVEQLFGDRAADVYPYLGALLGLTLEPEAAARLAQLSPEALQFRTFEVVETLLRRLADDGPVVVAIEDLHWADAVSVQLVERLLGLGEDAAVLLAVTQRDERDHPSWRIREVAARQFPHLVEELSLEPLPGEAEAKLLDALVGAETLPAPLRDRILGAAEGNPFYLEELVRSLADAGALVHSGDGWRFDHEVPVEIPQTVEKVILARIDRLPASCHRVLTAASVLGRRFALPLLEGVIGEDGFVRDALHELQRLDLVRTGRRWPQPEYRFKHVLIQEATYRTLLSGDRRELHRKAAEWLEQTHAENLKEVLGLLAHHWLHAADDEKAVAYLTRAGDSARQEWALDEAIAHYRALLPLLERRGEEQEMALVLFKLALALHTALRFGEANEAYQQAFQRWSPPAAGTPAATLEILDTALPKQPDPPRSYFLSDIQLQMALFDRLVERWPEATIVPSLAERWDIAADGLRYVFHLREGLSWSDGTPLTAHDVEYGVKRNLDRERPGVSAAMLFALEGAQDYCLGRADDLAAVGVRALDDRTVEFRLAAPAPYFLSMVNRPDAGPQPRHAIEASGDGWTEPAVQVVSGAFREVERTPGRVVLERRPDAFGRPGNVARVELRSGTVDELVESYGRDTVDVANARITAGAGDLIAAAPDEARVEPPAWLFFLVLNHHDPALERLEVRRALAHAIDREALASALPPNVIAATGGVVPPVLQGHTPDIVPRFDPELARRLLDEAGVRPELTITAPPAPVLARLADAVGAIWQRTLGITVRARVLKPEESPSFERPGQVFVGSWFPGYPDPEYYLRLLLHSDATDNWGHFSHPPFDDLIERARREHDGRARLELFHEADRMAVAEQVATIPLAYARNVALVKPWVRGWWEFGKSWSSFADLVVDEDLQAAARR